MTAPRNHDQKDVDRQQKSAADLIRTKLDRLYDGEPDAKEEIEEVDRIPEKQLSKHQRHMKDLTASGKSLAEIQVAWHQYYASLSDAGKHEVWQEFYSEHEEAKKQQKAREAADASAKEAASEASVDPSAEPAVYESTTVSELTAESPKPALPVSHNTASSKKKKRRAPNKTPVDLSTAKDVKRHLLTQVQDRSEIRKNTHVRSLVFGLSVGTITLFFLLFGFFNERFITPFIRPNTNVSATPIIVDPNGGGPVGPEAKIIIPKINVEAPVVYGVPSIAEEDVQKGLEDGVVHYITTPNPGEKGNSVIFGHSSSNILNKGKFKFAFLMLKSLNNGDTFIVQKDGKRYVYKVYNKFVTPPDDLSVLGATDKVASMTLVTCDPPGTSTNRLIIQAEQIFPDPAANAESSVASGQVAGELPSNSVTLWQRIKDWF